MKHVTGILGIAVCISIGTFVPQAAAVAQIAPDPEANARHSRVVGLWDVEVVVENCVTGVPVASFLALHQYDLGGTGQVVPTTNPSALSAHMMIWSHVSGNNYRMAFKMYRYDAAGNYIGWAVVRNEISINEAANEYVGTGVAEIFNAAGNFVASSCPAFIGTRFTGE